MPPDEPERRPRRGLAQRLLSGAAWAFAAKLVGAGSALAINALLARMLSLEEFGAYFLVSSVAMFLAVVARFGMRQTVVRLVAESVALGRPGRARAALKHVFATVAVCALIVVALYVFVLADVLARRVFDVALLATVTGLTAGWIALLALQTPVAETFRGLHDIRLAVFFDGVLANAALAGMLAALWLWGTGVDFGRAVALSVLSVALSLVLASVLFVRRARRLRGEGDVRPAEVLRISAPLFVENLASQAMTNASLWIVGAFLLASDVALYGAAWKLVNMIALPLMLMNMSVQPVIAELYAREEKGRLQNALRGTATLASIPAALVLIVFIAFGGPVLQAVFGEPYRAAATVLAILSVGQLANAWTGSCALVLSFTGHQKVLMNITLATSAVSVAAIVAGTMAYGMIGAAAGVAAGRIVQNLAGWLAVRRLTGLWTHGTVSPAFIRLAWDRVRSRRKT